MKMILFKGLEKYTNRIIVSSSLEKNKYSIYLRSGGKYHLIEPNTLSQWVGRDNRKQDVFENDYGVITANVGVSKPRYVYFFGKVHLTANRGACIKVQHTFNSYTNKFEEAAKSTYKTISFYRFEKITHIINNPERFLFEYAKNNESK